jgi:epoxide hydrolase 4
MKKKTRLISAITISIFLMILLIINIVNINRDQGDFSVIKDDDPITHENVEINGITLNVAIAGPKSGEPVILLHGYPDAHFGWRDQIVALASRGFRVIAPDQRGYNLSEKPKGVENYMQEVLVSDIIALADNYGFETFNLAGHDFGGIVSWNLADTHAVRLKKMVIFNSPHPAVNQKFQEENEKQKKKSWYAYFFKLPLIPELVMKAGNWKFGERAMEESYTENEINEYKRAWSQKGANRATINWYRGLFKQDLDRRFDIIDVPTLIVWGKADPHIMWEQAEPSAAMTSEGRVVYIENATHWVMRDASEQTSQILIDFFTEE